MRLFEQYRPHDWGDVVGQPEVLALIDRLRPRGLSGRAYWLAAGSGRGKTTIARLIAAECADPWAITEYDDPAQLRADELERIGRDHAYRPIGKGVAYIVNEAHGLRRDQVRKLLGLTENVPPWVVWCFTTTVEGQKSLFEGVDDAHPLLSRCTELPLRTEDLDVAFAIRAREIAQAENMDGQPLDWYLALVRRHKLNMRAVLQEIETGVACNA